MDHILVVGLRELGVHGVLPEERTRAQPFEVDLDLSVDLEAAGASDALEDTVDYGTLSEHVRASGRPQTAPLLSHRTALLP